MLTNKQKKTAGKFIEALRRRDVEYVEFHSGDREPPISMTVEQFAKALVEEFNLSGEFDV
jgi:hypothetical protein